MGDRFPHVYWDEGSGMRDINADLLAAKDQHIAELEAMIEDIGTLKAEFNRDYLKLEATNQRLREQIKLIASKEESLAADNLRLREKLKAVGRGGGDFGGARG